MADQLLHSLPANSRAGTTPAGKFQSWHQPANAWLIKGCFFKRQTSVKQASNKCQITVKQLRRYRVYIILEGVELMDNSFSRFRSGTCWIICGLLIIAAVACMMLFSPKTVYADSGELSSDDGYTNQQLYEKWTGNSSEPSGFSSNNTDPYGYGQNVPFYMNKQSELALYATNNMNATNTTCKIKSYNLDINTNVPVTASGTEGTSYDIPQNNNGSQYKILNYVKMVAFDPTGSGRDDHIAVIGINNEGSNENGQKGLWLYVYSKDGKVRSDYLRMGNVTWTGNRYSNDGDNCYLKNAMNFVGITAGDYDNDDNHKDTLIVWGCYDGTGYGLTEVDLTETSNKITISKKNETPSKTLLHDRYTASGSELARGTDENTDTDFDDQWVDNKLCCALDTGDVNGDRIDDLVVLSYVDILTNSHGGRVQQTEMYRPYLTVSYGNSSGSVLERKSKAIPVMNNTSGNEYETCFGASLSLGDINGDSKDEVVIAGLKNILTGVIGNKVSDPYDFDESDILLAAYDCSGTPNVQQQLLFETKDANDWTSAGLYPAESEDDKTDDQVIPQYGLKCVAINGPSKPDMVFLNGDLYSYKPEADVKMAQVYQMPYFQQAHRRHSIGGTFPYPNADITNTCFLSVAAGNFDGNDYGYEQVVFTYALKRGGHEWYNAAAGMLGGDVDKGTTNGYVNEYFGTSKDVLGAFGTLEGKNNPYFPDTLDGDLTGAHLSSNRGLNYCVCAVDNDDDGVLARYHKKGYAYSDPEVLAVLQAAPRFADLSNYAGDNETTYSFSHSVTEESGNTDTVSFGAGACTSLEAGNFVIDAKAGYVMDWSSEFRSGLTKTSSYSYTTRDKDAVVLYRTPVTLYEYQIKQPDGSWETDGKYESLILSFPGRPAYSILSVDRYNQFADYYNRTNKERIKNVEGATEADAPTLALLNDSDDKKYYLNTGGDPTKYIDYDHMPSGVTILQEHGNAFEVCSDASTSFAYDEEHSSTHSTSMAHGFSFELTIQYKVGIPHLAESSFGGYASLEVMRESSTSTTVANSKGISCTVNNANLDSMIQDGYSPAACASYGFSYQMATWDSPIMEEVPVQELIWQGGLPQYTEHAIPVYGFVVDNVHKPTYPAIIAPQNLTLREGYKASTSGAFRINADPPATVTMVSGNEKIAYNPTTRKLEVAPGLGIGTYPVQLKAVNGIPGKEAICNFTVSVTAPDLSEGGAIASVRDMISSLPTPEEMLLSDEIYVVQAREAFDALTNAQKAQISSALQNKLQNAEAQIQGFKDAAAAAEGQIVDFVGQINGTCSSIGTNVPTDTQMEALENALNNAEEAYNNLSNEQKAIVSADCINGLAGATEMVANARNKYDQFNNPQTTWQQIQETNQTAANGVIILINAIDLSGIDPETTDDQAFTTAYNEALAAAEAARTAYNNLTAPQRYLVTNAAALFAAETNLGMLITSRNDSIASQQEAALLQDCKNLINALPGTVTLADEAKVLAAKFAYDYLSPKSKAKVDPALVTKLNNAVSKINALKAKAAYNKKVKAAKAYKVSGFKAVSKKKKTAVLTWKKNKNATGYQISYAKKKNFKGAKKKKIKGASKKKATISKLKRKKTYYFKIRTYKTIKNPSSGKNVTVYGKWTKAKKVKIK